MDDEAQAFANRVLFLRVSRGWTQTDLGDRMVPRTNAGVISSIEKGRNPNQRTVIALARAFGLAVHELYGSTETAAEVVPRLPPVLAELVREAAQESEELQRALLALIRACRTIRGSGNPPAGASSSAAEPLAPESTEANH